MWKTKEDFLAMLLKEIESRSVEQDIKAYSIYFGGGTPSILSMDELGSIFESLHRYLRIPGNIELTLEANPEDINLKMLRAWQSLGINRLSIGVQSFQNSALEQMHRTHSGKQAEEAILMSIDNGFQNLTIDLMYGRDGGHKTWQKDLDKFYQLNVPHLSAYCLTVEPKTLLAHQIKKYQIKATPERQVVEDYLYLMNSTIKRGYEAYEISNFAKPGFRALHNSSYWKRLPYIGFGPGAHSYDGSTKRRWNVANNPKYIRALANNEKYWEDEILSNKDMFNERIMLSLRTNEGLNLFEMRRSFPNMTKVFERKLPGFEHYFEREHDIIRLTAQGRLISDNICTELFCT